jgi:hypothetical protein
MTIERDSDSCCLDSIDRISYKNNFPPLPNAHALGYLTTGLNTLYHTVLDEEKKQLKKGGGIRLLAFDQGTNLVACAHHWFAVSVVNYCRLVKLIDLMVKNNWTIENLHGHTRIVKEECKKYCANVLGPIFVWRNKVAAHFSITDPYGSDTLGTLENSIIQPVSFEVDHYYVSSFQMGRDGFDPPEIPRWSLIQEYEKLIPRFWPMPHVC